MIHHLEEILICLAPEEVKAGNFEVGPEVAHVVFLSLHSVGVKLGRLQAVGVGGEDFLGKRWVSRLGFLLRGVVDKHLPETLGGDVVKAFVGGGVAEEVGDGLLELLDGDGETISLVVLDHLQEGVAERS